MQQQFLTITLLGTGTSTGIPVVGCDCPVCRSAIDLNRHNRRTRCSALLSDGDKSILIDTSPDLRHQALRAHIRQVDAVFYTHGHADHVHGIDDLRAFNHKGKTPIPLYGSEETLKHIEQSFCYIFDDEENYGYLPNLVLRPLTGPVTVGRMEIIPIPIQHGNISSYGYRCGPVAYLTDCNAIPEDSLQMLKGLKLLILDGLRFNPHPTHFCIPESIRMAQRIGAELTLLTHIAHDVDHDRHDRELPEGINLAYDGQTFRYPL